VDAALNEEWHARLVLFVADIDRTLDFYANTTGTNARPCCASAAG